MMDLGTYIPRTASSQPLRAQSSRKRSTQRLCIDDAAEMGWRLEAVAAVAVAVEALVLVEVAAAVAGLAGVAAVVRLDHNLERAQPPAHLSHLSYLLLLADGPTALHSCTQAHACALAAATAVSRWSHVRCAGRCQHRAGALADTTNHLRRTHERGAPLRGTCRTPTWRSPPPLHAAHSSVLAPACAPRAEGDVPRALPRACAGAELDKQLVASR